MSAAPKLAVSTTDDLLMVLAAAEAWSGVACPGPSPRMPWDRA